MRERLKWSEEEFRKIPAAKRCHLPKYRLAFNKRDSTGKGCTNVIPDTSESVEGVLYTLTEKQIHFLDKENDGYTRRTMSRWIEER